MSIDPQRLRIVHYPAPILRTRAEQIPPIGPELQAVARRMLDMMHEANGVGLAAPQVGLPWRLFVANPSGEVGDDHVFVNPVITPLDKELDEMEEGCLSLPDIRAPIRRPKAVRLEATGLEGRAVVLEDAAFPARVWQHETDHLDGVLILDRMVPVDKLAVRRQLRQLEQAAAAER